MPKNPPGWSVPDNMRERVDVEIMRRKVEKDADTLGENYWVREIEKSLARSLAESIPIQANQSKYPGKQYGASKRRRDEMQKEAYEPEYYNRDRLEKTVLLPLRVEKESEETYRIIGDFTVMSDRMRERLQQDFGTRFDITEELWGLRLTLKKRA